MKAKSETRITVAEIKLMRITAKYMCKNYKINEEILKQLRTEIGRNFEI
jgi:hypothetical protein